MTHPTAPSAASPADAALIERHLTRLPLRGHSRGTIDSRRRALTRLAAALPAPLLEATSDDLLRWRIGLRCLAPATVRSYVSHTHQFYVWALATALVAENPAAGLPVPPKPRRLPRPIGEEDLLAALASAPPRIRPWLVLAGWAGLRAKEIAYLRRENVFDRLPAPVILVASDATKGRAERTVPVSAFVGRELRPVLAAAPPRGYIFRRRDGLGGPPAPHTVSHLANDHLHTCGIAATLHQLRHRFGTETYRASKDLRAVQELMGHADPATTAGYAAYDRAVAAAAVEALAAPGPVALVPQLAR